MSDLSDLSSLLKEPEPTSPKTIKKFDWDWQYIAQYIVDLRNHDDVEILQCEYIPIIGDMDSDCYFSECVHNARAEDFLPTHFTGHFNFDDTEHMDVKEPGVYRLVFGVRTDGSKTWTDCGYEYDAWEEYDLISQYKFTDEETTFLTFNEETEVLYDE